MCVWCTLVCEVKKSAKHPWIVLSTSRGDVEPGGYARPYSSENIEGLNLNGDEIDSHATTKPFTRIGRSYFEGFKSPDAKSAIFDALTTTVKASEYILKNDIPFGGQGNDKRPVISFFEPIIVFDGQLFEAYINECDCLELNQINHIPVFFGYISSNYDRARYMVEIVTLEGFPELLSKKQKWIDDVRGTIERKLTTSSNNTSSMTENLPGK